MRCYMQKSTCEGHRRAPWPRASLGEHWHRVQQVLNQRRSSAGGMLLWHELLHQVGCSVAAVRHFQYWQPGLHTIHEYTCNASAQAHLEHVIDEVLAIKVHRAAAAGIVLAQRALRVQAAERPGTTRTVKRAASWHRTERAGARAGRMQ